MAMVASSKIKSAQLSVTIIRADGTVENLGVVSSYESTPLKRLILRIKERIENIKLSLFSK